MKTPEKKIRPAGIFLMIAIVFGAPFLPLFITRQWNWWQAWAYVVVSILSFVISRIIMAIRHPDLLAERSRALEPRNTKSWDIIITPAIGLASIGILVVAGLEKNNGWSDGFSVILNLAGFAGLTLGYAFTSWAPVVNRFFSGTVRIQKDRGQTVVSAGPYRIIRHPGYAGSIAGSLCIPFLLDSVWAFVPAILFGILLVIRTSLEDKTLQKELPGYKRYTQKTRYRLLPGVW